MSASLSGKHFYLLGPRSQITVIKMNNEIYASIGRHAAPLYEYDFTDEYLLKLRGASYIPARKKEGYKLKSACRDVKDYESPLKVAIKNSRPAGRKRDK